ncbi:MAG: nitroreductase family protein [Dehalococcoidia bacterium]|nr:nitroreductase family protein [Dehalococcoidia bacterium]
MELREAIETRRSIRRFGPRPVRPRLVEEICRAGLRAPAPHHTRPWRFVIVEPGGSRERLAEEMGQAWRNDLQGDGVPAAKITALLGRSRTQIVTAPALVLCGLVAEGLRDWPDPRRRVAEWSMAGHSMGAALQNIMLVAHDAGLASYWISAPLFAADAVRSALDLSDDFVAQALVAVGYPHPSYQPRARPQESDADFVVHR